MPTYRKAPATQHVVAVTDRGCGASTPHKSQCWGVSRACTSPSFWVVAQLSNHLMLVAVDEGALQ